MEGLDTIELLAHADALYEQGRLVESLGAYEAAVAHDPNAARAYNRIGAIHAQTGHPELAEQALTKALELDPNLAAAHSNLGNVYYSRGDYAQAQVLYQRALELEPANPLFHENLHAAFKKQGKYAEAVAQLKLARRLIRDEARGEAKSKYSAIRQSRPVRRGCFTIVAITLSLIVFSSLCLATLAV